MELEKSFREHSDRISGQDRLITWLYGHTMGRMLLRPLVSPWFSRAGGWLLQTRLSALAVRPYVKANQIDLSLCEKQQFRSFNDFFTRRLRPGTREISMDPQEWISPCDSRLTVYPISREGRFQIKHTPYTLEQLLGSTALAGRYMGGELWLYRLCVDDYHRYIYPVDGVKSANIRIPGVFHTVNPIAAEAEPIYKMNTREYCLIRTETVGTVLMMEVGAMLVGKIENRCTDRAAVLRGAEKGNFAFGGSTIVVLSQPGRVTVRDDIAEASRSGRETRVRLGEVTGAVVHRSPMGMKRL
jgi:phosphatidylserine decarboxylase